VKARHAIPLVLLASALLVGFGVAAAAGGGGGSDRTTLHLVEHAKTDTLQHIGPPSESDSIGDILGFGNPVFNASNKKKVGTDNGMCTRTKVGLAFECIWTVSLSNGQMTVEGPFYDKKDSVLAITGGTGAYKQARGQMRLHARNAKGTAYDFIYKIIR
jgi:allene oxide cyclase